MVRPAGWHGFVGVMVAVLLACAACSQPADPPGPTPERTPPPPSTSTTEGSWAPGRGDRQSPSPGRRLLLCPGFRDEEPRRGTRYADILGTEDSDHIVGTAKREIICGLGGDDTIEGGGGGDLIYGGPGDDHLTYTESGSDGRIGPGDVFQLFGGDGDDVLEIKRVSPDDIYPDLLVGGAGNDALIGPIVGPGVLFEGGTGHDAMIGTPLTTIGNNDMNGGDGHDVAMAFNLSTGLRRPDQIDLDGKPELTLGTTCTVAVPMTPQPRESSQGKVTCGIPWPRELAGLKDIVSISTSIDETGKVSFDASMYEGLAGLSVSGWRDVVDVQGSFSGDTCICDPLIPVGQAPKHSGQPLDWSK